MTWHFTCLLNVIQGRSIILGHLADFSPFAPLQYWKDLNMCYFLSKPPAVCTTLNGGMGTVFRGVKCPKNYWPRLQLARLTQLLWEVSARLASRDVGSSPGMSLYNHKIDICLPFQTSIIFCKQTCLDLGKLSQPGLYNRFLIFQE